MKVLKNRLVIFIIIIIIMLILAGVLITTKIIVQEHKDKNNDIILLKVSMSNGGLVNSSEDYWSSTKCTVYYGGDVKIINTYNLSGKERIEKKISKENYTKLYDLLANEFVKINNNAFDLDGIGCSIEYFNESGDIIHEFRGSINEKDEVLSEIIEILNL